MAHRSGQTDRKPLMIHNRRPTSRCSDVLRAEGAPNTVTFTASHRALPGARRADAGRLVSLSGTVSFRNARELREAVPLVPRRSCWWRPDAPSSHPTRTGARRTSRTACPTLCGRWPNCRSAGRRTGRGHDRQCRRAYGSATSGQAR